MGESVAAIIFDKEKQHVYMMKRRDVPLWVFPGGGIEPGESPEDAIIREVREEMGFSVTILRKVAFYKKSGPFTKPTHFYECAIENTRPWDPGETLEVTSFPIQSFPKTTPPYKEWLEDALLISPKTLEKKIKSVNIWSILWAITVHPIFFCRFIFAKIGRPINTITK